MVMGAASFGVPNLEQCPAARGWWHVAVQKSQLGQDSGRGGRSWAGCTQPQHAQMGASGGACTGTSEMCAGNAPTAALMHAEPRVCASRAGTWECLQTPREFIAGILAFPSCARRQPLWEARAGRSRIDTVGEERGRGDVCGRREAPEDAEVIPERPEHCESPSWWWGAAAEVKTSLLEASRETC